MKSGYKIGEQVIINCEGCPWNGLSGVIVKHVDEFTVRFTDGRTELFYGHQMKSACVTEEEHRLQANINSAVIECITLWEEKTPSWHDLEEICERWGVLPSLVMRQIG
ncbi:hypothetical protein [Cerasicoccus fimbriatus]|uniref:hypothetical protein n=1 Tax=Cerasicoccus fimbriatus TaxID=3014554 RepID=UPI0022B427C7|nr:hypothetical protein [Cerasicoccus sp. TK19100]